MPGQQAKRGLKSRGLIVKLEIKLGLSDFFGWGRRRRRLSHLAGCLNREYIQSREDGHFKKKTIWLKKKGKKSPGILGSFSPEKNL